MSGFGCLFSALVLLLAALGAPLAANAATVTVPGDFATVQQAVDAVQNDTDPGEVILASNGPFDTSVIVSQTVTIRAANGFTPVIEPTAGFGSPIEIRASAGAATAVTLRGLRLRASNASGGSGTAIAISNESTTEPLAVSVEQLQVEVLIGDHGIRAGSGYGGEVTITVTGSHFEVEGDGSGQPACIFVDPPSFPLTLMAAGNELRFSRASGIVVDPGIDAPVFATIDRNRFEGFSSLSGAGRSGLVVNGPNADGNIRAEVAATNNLFVRNETALDLNGQAQNDLMVFFANDTVVGGSYAGILVQAFGASSVQLDLFNNVLVGTAGVGIDTFESNGTTLVVNEGHNLFFGNAIDYQGLVPSPSDGFADPQFVDAAADDYRLAASSPAIDAGTNTPTGGALPPLDFDGQSRIVDGDGNTTAVVDIGAFEVPEPVAAAAAWAAFTALGALRRARRRGSARASKVQSVCAAHATSQLRIGLIWSDPCQVPRCLVRPRCAPSSSLRWEAAAGVGCLRRRVTLIGAGCSRSSSAA